MKSITAGQQEARLDDLRRLRDQAEREASHQDVEREHKRIEALAANALHARVVRKWEQGRKEALRAERQFSRQFGAKQLSIGTSAFYFEGWKIVKTITSLLRVIKSIFE